MLVDNAPVRAAMERGVAAGALEFARSQGYRWLYLDPESPSSARLDLS